MRASVALSVCVVETCRGCSLPGLLAAAILRPLKLFSMIDSRSHGGSSRSAARSLSADRVERVSSVWGSGMGARAARGGERRALALKQGSADQGARRRPSCRPITRGSLGTENAHLWAERGLGNESSKTLFPVTPIPRDA